MALPELANFCNTNAFWLVSSRLQVGLASMQHSVSSSFASNVIHSMLFDFDSYALPMSRASGRSGQRHELE